MSYLRADFPGQDAGIINDDWIILKTKELLDKMANNFQGALNDYLTEFFKSTFISTVYVENTKTIRLEFKEGTNV